MNVKIKILNIQNSHENLKFEKIIFLIVIIIVVYDFEDSHMTTSDLKTSYRSSD